MAAISPNFRHKGAIQAHRFATTAGVAIAKGQLVKFGADAATITGTTSASDKALIGIAAQAIASGAAGPTTFCEVFLLAPGDIFPMIAGGTVTAGKFISCQGTDGKITDSGATPAVGEVVGQALATTATAGDLVAVLVCRA